MDSSAGMGGREYTAKKCVLLAWKTKQGLETNQEGNFALYGSDLNTCKILFFTALLSSCP